MAQGDVTVFEKLHEASQLQRDVTLTFAEIELLLGVLGENFGLAEQEYEKWSVIFEDYEINSRPRQ